MIALSEITAEEVQALSNTSNIQLIVKDGVFDASSLNALIKDMDTIANGGRGGRGGSGGVGGILTPAKMGINASNSTNGSNVSEMETKRAVLGSVLRGDLTCWVTPELCRDQSLPGMKSYVQAMIKVLKPFHQELGLVADYSVQCALYPGKGSGYVRHIDHSRVRHQNTVQNVPKAASVRGRKLTAILYLNEEWEEWEGGQLRVHIPLPSSMNSSTGRPITDSSSSGSSSSSSSSSSGSSSSASSSNSIGSSGNVDSSSRGVTPSVPTPPPKLIGQNLKGVTLNNSANPYIDIDPILGRMVVFRSDTVEHEVLPCHKDRRALTFWISADYPNTTATTASASNQPTTAAAVSNQSTSAATAATTPTTGATNSSAATTTAATTAAVDVATASASNRSTTAASNLIPSRTSNKSLTQEKQQQLKRSPFTIPDIHPFSLPPTHWDKMTIFISIASYCDSECGPTVRDAYVQASCPGRVYVGVAWQGMVRGQWDWEGERYRKGGKGEEGAGEGEGEGVVCPSFMSYNAPSSSSSSSSSSRGARGKRVVENEEVEDEEEDEEEEGEEEEEEEEEWVRAMKFNVRVSAIPSDQASGPCWARGVAFSLWRGERYLLQIDSHMRFRSGWDRYLIWQLEKTREEMMSKHDKEKEEEVEERTGEETKAEQEKNEVNLVVDGVDQGDGGDKDVQEKVQNIQEIYQYSQEEKMKSNTKMNEKSIEKTLGTTLAKAPAETPAETPAKIGMKPVLTTYPLGYRLPNAIPADTRATLLAPSHFDSSGMLKQVGRVITVSTPSPLSPPLSSPLRAENTRPPSPLSVLRTQHACIPSPLWASGFSFSDSSLLVEAPYDPRLSFLFFGEEISMAARFFTLGYDFFAPPEAVVYHLWTRDHRPAFFQDAIGAVTAKTVKVLKGREEKMEEMMEETMEGKMEEEEEEVKEEQKQEKREKKEKKEKEEVHGGQSEKEKNEKNEKKKLSQQREKQTKNGNQKEQQQHKQRVEQLRASSEQRIRSLLRMQGSSPLDTTCPIERRYGLGSIRSLSDFEERIGVCFSTLVITELPPLPGVRYCADDISDALSALSLSLSLSLSDTNGINRTNGVGSGSGTGSELGTGLGSGLGTGSESGRLNVPVQLLKSAPTPVRTAPSSSDNAIDALNIVRSYLLKNNLS